MNIVARRENGDCLIRISGLDDLKTRGFNHLPGIDPDQHLVLDNQHNRSLALSELHQVRPCGLAARQAGRDGECRLTDTLAKGEPAYGSIVP